MFLKTVLRTVFENIKNTIFICQIYIYFMMVVSYFYVTFSQNRKHKMYLFFCFSIRIILWSGGLGFFFFFFGVVTEMGLELKMLETRRCRRVLKKKNI